MIRKDLEQREEGTLSRIATLSGKSKGRVRPEEACSMRTAFMRDRDRIVHSKSFRRLKDKTQVFLSPQGDHYRTRLMHTLEVSQTARTIARCLRLNEDLVEAIALGHDLGHTPFGHAGEKALNAVCPLGFKHNEQSVRIAEVLEKNGQGLNLSYEVLDGIRNHGTASLPSTPEGQTVRLCDKIAYIHHDVDDAIRAGILSEEDIPAELRRTLGETTKARLNTMIRDIIEESKDKEELTMSGEILQAMRDLRLFLFENLYVNPVVKGEEQKAIEMLTELYLYYTAHPENLSGEYRQLLEQGEAPERVVCDYISGMTDQYSIVKFNEVYVPRSWSVY